MKLAVTNLLVLLYCVANFAYFASGTETFTFFTHSISAANSLEVTEGTDAIVIQGTLIKQSPLSRNVNMTMECACQGLTVAQCQLIVVSGVVVGGAPTLGFQMKAGNSLNCQIFVQDGYKFNGFQRYNLTDIDEEAGASDMLVTPGVTMQEWVSTSTMFSTVQAQEDQMNGITLIGIAPSLATQDKGNGMFTGLRSDQSSLLINYMPTGTGTAQVGFHGIDVSLGTVCGDGIVAGLEQCEQNVNGIHPLCCSGCNLRNTTFQCREHNGHACDVADVCGADYTCPDQKAKSVVCRPALDGSVCDVAEECNGVDDECPADEFAPETTLCRTVNAGDLCDKPEYCTGEQALCPEDMWQPITYKCRTATLLCDVDDYCLGDDETNVTLAKLCVDHYRPDTHECRPTDDTNPCDVAEFCTGTTSKCPSDGDAATGTPCGVDTMCYQNFVCTADGECVGEFICACSADTECDDGNACTDDTCNKDMGGVCVNTNVEEGRECRAANGDCDEPEHCDGQGKCPRDVVKDKNTRCRVATGDCDVREFCDGVSPECPEDQYAKAGTVCRAANETLGCDLPDLCTGDSPDCADLDVVELAGTVCRESAGQCDLVERCDGVSPVCPDDEVASDGQTCNDNKNCTSTDQCVDGACKGTYYCECASTLECSNSNVCGDVECVGNMCVFTAKANDTTCDDDRLCTVGDSCQSGVCVGAYTTDGDGRCPSGCSAHGTCCGDSCECVSSAWSGDACDEGPYAALFDWCSSVEPADKCMAFPLRHTDVERNVPTAAFTVDGVTALLYADSSDGGASALLQRDSSSLGIDGARLTSASRRLIVSFDTPVRVLGVAMVGTGTARLRLFGDAVSMGASMIRRKRLEEMWQYLGESDELTDATDVELGADNDGVARRFDTGADEMNVAASSVAIELVDGDGFGIVEIGVAATVLGAPVVTLQPTMGPQSNFDVQMTEPPSSDAGAIVGVTFLVLCLILVTIMSLAIVYRRRTRSSSGGADGDRSLRSLSPRGHRASGRSQLSPRGTASADDFASSSRSLRRSSRSQRQSRRFKRNSRGPVYMSAADAVAVGALPLAVYGETSLSSPQSQYVSTPLSAFKMYGETSLADGQVDQQEDSPNYITLVLSKDNVDVDASNTLVNMELSSVHGGDGDDGGGGMELIRPVAKQYGETSLVEPNSDAVVYGETSLNK